MNHSPVAFRSSILFAGAALALVLAACSITSTDSKNAAGATSAQVSECKSSCDKMKFFQCSSASELASCYNDCDTAAPSKIDIFNGCAQNSICDPACRTNIAPAPSSSGGSTMSSGGGGVAAADCQSACDKLIKTCNLAPLSAESDCVSKCQSSGYQYQIDCVINNQCGDIMSRCGGSSSSGSSSSGSSGVGTGSDAGSFDVDLDRCQQDCQTLNFQMCITAQQFSTCQTACSANTGAKRTTFMQCVESSSGCTNGTGCFDAYTQ